MRYITAEQHGQIMGRTRLVRNQVEADKHTLPFEDISALSNETKSMIYGYVNNILWLRRPVHSILKEMEKVLNAPQGLNLNDIDANVNKSEVRYTEMMAINEWFETVKSLKFNRTKPFSEDIQTTNA
uniref:Uncharacterized protein n=1 Tax=Acrobeloides nanus TaxID=290746 RepID=A0A914CZ11_9BILA